MVNIANETSRLFQDSANLVQSWGNTMLDTGKTLRQTLTIQEVSLWDIMEVELAMYKIPQALRHNSRISSTLTAVRPYLGRVKQKAINFIKGKFSTLGCVAWPKESTVLFLGFKEDFYFDILAPVVYCISKEEGGLRTIFLRDGYNKQAQAGKDQYPSQHWDTGLKVYLALLKREFNRARKELYTQSALSSIIQNEGRSLWLLMQDTFTWLFHQRIPQLLPQIAAAKHILEIHCPVLVISPDVADPRTRIYHLLCRKFNIPSLDIQQGLVLPNSVEYQFFQADRVAAFGQESREIMLAHGVADRQITVTGSPRHDSLGRITANEQERIRLRLGLPLKKRIILFAATYYMAGFPKVKALGTLMTEAIFAAADQSPGVCLVVKPHPVFSQQLKELKSHAGGRCNIIFTDPKDSIQELIKACDAFLTFGSTTTLDALIMNKLVITPSFPGWSANDQFAESEATLVARTPQEIMQIFQAVANGSFQETLIRLEPARVRFLENWIFKSDGKASQRIYNLIKEMIGLRK